MHPWVYVQFAQELLSTFGTTLGEVVLVPMTGGVFTVAVTTSSNTHNTHNTDNTDTDTVAGTDTDTATGTVVIWDRKRDGGFPGSYHTTTKVYNTVPSYYSTNSY